MSEKKNNKKQIIITIIILISVSAIGYSAYAYWQEKQNTNQNTNNLNKQEKITEVESIKINSATTTKELYINNIGTVEAESKVNVTASNKGTVRLLSFDVGDKVDVGQVLAYLKNNNTQTTYLNAQTHYYNMLNNLEATKRTGQENVNQAEIGIEKSQEAINNAKDSLENAKKTYNNAIELQEKNLENTKSNAVISYNNYLQTVKNTLEDINYIINAEPGPQLENISKTLSAKSFAALVKAKNTYKTTKNEYNNLKDENPNKENILNYLEEIKDLLEKTKKSTNETIIVLDNTVSSSNFPQSSLLAQQDKFASLYNKVVNTLQNVDNSINNLNTTELNYEKETISLKNNIQLAENQLKNSEIAYNNALTSLNSVKESKKQQILSAQTQVDSALGQLNLSQEQLSDLTITAPISGQITKKNIEVGAELNPGQVIAEISKVNNVKVIINLPSEDVYQINLGQEVIINQDIKANITNIAPNANEQTKKVKVEILVNNKEKKLITGTFVDVKIKKANKNISKDNTIKIPLEAVIITQTESYVYLVKNNKNNELIAKKQVVNLGDSEANLVEIKSGLNEGDEIIVTGSKSIENNDLIKIK